MPKPQDHRSMVVMVLLAVVTCGALTLIAAGIDVRDVKEVLAIVFPPLVALAATTVGTKCREG